MWPASTLAATSSNALLIVACVVLGACHVGFVQRAETHYRAGRYLEAVEKLTPYEDELETMSARRQARYSMVRGMALLEMGDREEAKRWLESAYDYEERGETLQASERAELDAAWRKLGGTPPAR